MRKWLFRFFHKIGLTQLTNQELQEFEQLEEAKRLQESKKLPAKTWWRNAKLGAFKVSLGNEGSKCMPNEIFETEEEAIQFGLARDEKEESTFRIYIDKYVECSECSNQEWKLVKVVTVREVNKLV